MAFAQVDLEEAFERVDLQGRLAAIPQGAAIRGVFFDMIDAALERHGLAATPTWVPQRTRRQLFKLYPIEEYLQTFATAAAILDPDPLRGMAEIYADGARFFAGTWFGRTLHQFLRPDPTPALGWIARSHDHFVNFGRWRFERRGPERGVLHLFDEYVWIEGAHKGGCEGLLVACGVEGSVDVELDTPFSGRLDVRWQRRGPSV